MMLSAAGGPDGGGEDVELFIGTMNRVTMSEERA